MDPIPIFPTKSCCTDKFFYDDDYDIEAIYNRRYRNAAFSVIELFSETVSEVGSAILRPRMSFRLRYLLLLITFLLFIYYLLYFGREEYVSVRYRSTRYDKVDTNSPFIFIGGIPRSGTTLMRAMLDAHPIVRCGEETRVIPRILALRSQWKRSEREWKRLQEAGISDDVINAAVSSFIVEVIAGHGAPAERLCNKDPFTLKSTTYLAELFPYSKFILMIRDGRATVQSIISRRVTITGFNLDDFRQCLTKWNAGISIMYDQCLAVGPERCLMVHYEQLVLHPKSEMRRLLEFLDVPWDDSVLNHEELIGKDIKLSKTERSSDQVIKPINLDALTKWVGKIPADVVTDMAKIAPMLETLGYDPAANPPNYGTPDVEVLQKTQDVHRRSDIWYKKAVEVVNDPGRVDLPFKAPAPLAAVDGEANGVDGGVPLGAR